MSDIREFHLLYIHDHAGERSYSLSAATYSIGRDTSNTFVVNDPTVSRHHALMIRLPQPNHHYVYQIIDGDLSGSTSKNGTFVNGHACQAQYLKSGDLIQIGHHCKISYIVAHMTQDECDEHFALGRPKLHSLSEEILDPTGTLHHLCSA